MCTVVLGNVHFHMLVYKYSYFRDHDRMIGGPGWLNELGSWIT